MSFILLVLEFYTVLSAQVKSATFGRISLRGRRWLRQLFCAALPGAISLKLLKLAPRYFPLTPYPDGHRPPHQVPGPGPGCQWIRRDPAGRSAGAAAAAPPDRVGEATTSSGLTTMAW
jgi:hypothetical protein